MEETGRPLELRVCPTADADRPSGWTRVLRLLLLAAGNDGRAAPASPAGHGTSVVARTPAVRGTGGGAGAG